jgi:pyridoxal phosphate enzyme (YggS family)
VPDLFCVSSVDTAKKCDELEKGRVDAGVEAKLNVHIQVNTSGEDSKSGVEPDKAAELCRHVKDKCPHLNLLGLMTIGAIARSQATTAETENEDFEALARVRREVAAELGVDEESLELSMGMSADFEAAIRQGSGEVRVGSQLFGERPARGDAKVKEDVEEAKE